VKTGLSLRTERREDVTEIDGILGLPVKVGTRRESWRGHPKSAARKHAQELALSNAHISRHWRRKAFSGSVKTGPLEFPGALPRERAFVWQHAGGPSPAERPPAVDTLLAFGWLRGCGGGRPRRSARPFPPRCASWAQPRITPHRARGMNRPAPIPRADASALREADREVVCTR